MVILRGRDEEVHIVVIKTMEHTSIIINLKIKDFKCYMILHTGLKQKKKCKREDNYDTIANKDTKLLKSNNFAT